MGQQLITYDDLDGSLNAIPDVEFSVQGVEYKIDLSEDNFHRLIDALRPFIASARHIANGKRIPEPIKDCMKAEKLNSAGAVVSESMRRHTPQELKAVRAWMTDHGIQHRGRGAIHSDIWEAWRADDLALLRPKNRPALEAAAS
jgi:hypothetical protein